MVEIATYSDLLQMPLFLRQELSLWQRRSNIRRHIITGNYPLTFVFGELISR